MTNTDRPSGSSNGTKPGQIMITWGIVSACVGVFFLLAGTVAGGVASPTTPLVLIIGGLALAVIGFARRILAAVEKR